MTPKSTDRSPLQKSTDDASGQTTTPDPTTAAERRVAKGAAQEVIGKLIGDDAVVTKGRAEQRAAERDLGEDAKR